MGIFFSSVKKIKRDEFRKVLKSISDLSNIERSYIEGTFQDALKDGISKEELKREIRDLKHNSNDSLNSYEVEKIKRKLEEYFK